MSETQPSEGGAIIKELAEPVLKSENMITECSYEPQLSQQVKYMWHVLHDVPEKFRKRSLSIYSNALGPRADDIIIATQSDLINWLKHEHNIRIDVDDNVEQIDEVLTRALLITSPLRG